MNLDFLRRLSIGFSQATAVHQLVPCETFGNSHLLNKVYADVPKTDGFPNPWHIGILNDIKNPNPDELIQGELELLALLFSLVVALKPRLVVETGTNLGLSARALGAGCWTNGFGRVVTSDIDQDMVAIAMDVCSGFPVEVRCCPSLELPELLDADLVFVDSSYESRSKEIGLVKSGATYVYHDTLGELWIRRQMKDEEYRVHLDTPRGFSIVRKA